LKAFEKRQEAEREKQIEKDKLRISELSSSNIPWDTARKISFNRLMGKLDDRLHELKALFSPS